ncbi:MAG: Tn3 family transposase [Streptosporangiaceae bacterium]
MARYLRDRELQREINTSLNVAESWNAGNSIINSGKGGDIPANRRDEQEIPVLCLRVLQRPWCTSTHAHDPGRPRRGAVRTERR